MEVEVKLGAVEAIAKVEVEAKVEAKVKAKVIRTGDALRAETEDALVG